MHMQRRFCSVLLLLETIPSSTPFERENRLSGRRYTSARAREGEEPTYSINGIFCQMIENEKRLSSLGA